MKSQILDKHGNQIEKSLDGTSNFQSDFWLIDKNKQSVKEVINNPYAKNVWVYACVRAIAQNVAQVTRNLQNNNTEETVKKHPITDLLKKPNNLMTNNLFIRTIINCLMLPTSSGGTGGQCFIVPWNTKFDEKVNLQKGEIPTELMPFSEMFFKPWLSEVNQGRQQSLGWIYKVPGHNESEIKFYHNEIIHIILPDPQSLLSGMSPFTPVASAIVMSAKADIFNTNIFDKQGKLDGLVTSDQPIDITELRKMQEEWYRQYVGNQQKKVAFLAGGLKYQQFGLSSQDMQYLDQDKWVRQKILAAYGLNRIAIGDYEDINFATIREGRKLLWYDTYIPTNNIITDAFNYQWITFVNNDQFSLKSDYSKIPALQSDTKDKATIIGILCTQGGFPPVLAARIVDIPLQNEDLERWPHLSEQLIKSSSPSFDQQQQLSIKSNKSIHDKYSEQYISKTLAPAENTFRKGLDKYFISQRNKILDKVDDLMKGMKSINKSVSGWEFLPDESLETFNLLKMHKQATQLQAALEKKQIENDLHRPIQWDVDGTRVSYYSSLRAGYLKDINTTTLIHAKDAINETIKNALEEGLTVPEASVRVKQAVHDVYEVRLGKTIIPNGLFDLGGMSSSKTIARTEMGNIATLTRVDIFKKEGIEKIEWITAHDEKVRDTHVLCEQDGVIKFGNTFSNGLRYPRDPNGSAGEVINCRCSFIAVFEE